MAPVPTRPGPGDPLSTLRAAYTARLAGVPPHEGEDRGDGPVVGYVGTDVPVEVLDAAGIRAVRVCGDPGAPTPLTDDIAEPAIDGMARSQLERLLDGTYAGLDAVLVGHDTEAAARLFHYAAECRHLGIGRAPPVHMVDVSHLPKASSLAYTRAVVGDVRRLAAELSGRPVTDDDLGEAIGRSAARARALAEARRLRRAPVPRLGGADALAVVGAAATLAPDAHRRALHALLDDADELPTREGRRILLTGSAFDHPGLYLAVESRGLLVVGEDHDWGDGWFDPAPTVSPAEPVPATERPGLDGFGLGPNGHVLNPGGLGLGPGGFDSGLDGDLDLVLARRYHGGAPRSGRHPARARAAHVVGLALAAGAEAVVAVLRRGDDGPPWDVPAQRAALAPHDIPLVTVTLDGYSGIDMAGAADAVLTALGDRHDRHDRHGLAGRTYRNDRNDRPGAAPPPPAVAPGPPQGPGPTAPSGHGPFRPAGAATRPAPTDRPDGAPTASGRTGTARPRREGLAASAEAASYQRRWFAEMQAEVGAGAPLAVVNADAPHEVLRAMGIPYVVNQWWSSLCAARQQGGRYLGRLRALGYPDTVEAYSAMALGSALDADPTDAPWGGLPRPDLLVAETTTDATGKIFEAWAEAHDVGLALLDSPVAPLRPRRWFESIHDGWEQVLGSRRLDLMVAQIGELVALVEERTGRRFDEARFAEVMALADEQAVWNARTRDLIARTVPAPVAVADTIPATMIPQWHRGSAWGRDAARRLHDEVAARVEAGVGVVPDERARLMWIGRGLWFDMGFYQRIQDRHGAVFVWSMYLAVAADAYLRRGGDPLRALAARFCGFADLYNTPPWSSEWYAKEAVHNRVDGVVHLATDAVRGSRFVTRAVEATGIPVLELSGSNVDARAWDGTAADEAVDAFIESRVLPRAEARRNA